MSSAHPPAPRAATGRQATRPVSGDPSVARPVLDAADVGRALTRIAHEIVERNHGAGEVVVLGIPTRGVSLAQRIGARIAAIEAPDIEGRDIEAADPASLPVGSVDVTMYRDDLRLRGVRALESTDIPPDGVDGKVVVLVDDVLFSGRTVRAALDALSDLGRPRAVQLAVLVDRGHRELPIRADYVGKNIPTAFDDDVAVRLAEIDGRDAVEVVRAG